MLVAGGPWYLPIIESGVRWRILRRGADNFPYHPVRCLTSQVWARAIRHLTILFSGMRCIFCGNLDPRGCGGWGQKACVEMTGMPWVPQQCLSYSFALSGPALWNEFSRTLDSRYIATSQVQVSPLSGKQKKMPVAAIVRDMIDYFSDWLPLWGDNADNGTTVLCARLVYSSFDQFPTVCRRMCVIVCVHRVCFSFQDQLKIISPARVVSCSL